MKMKRILDKIHRLWAKGVDFDQKEIKKAMKKNELLHLDIDFTAKCNLNCFYCDRTPDRFSRKNREELTLAERKNVIAQAKALGAKTVEVPGAGEPLLDPYFWETIEYINGLKIIPVIFTSGHQLDENTVDKLFKKNVTIFIKYNHTDPVIQDKIVKYVGYGIKANKIFQMFQDKGFNKTKPTRLAVDMVITPQYHDIDIVKTIFRYCRNNNIHFYITTLIPEGIADNKNKLMHKTEADQLLEEFRLIDEREFGIKYTPTRPMIGGYQCNQVNVGVHVNLYGEVYDCNGLGRFLGHIKQNTLAEIWNSAYARYIRSNFQNGYCLPRERVWNGIEEKGMDRKVIDYFNWKTKNGTDKIVECGLKYLGYYL